MIEEKQRLAELIAQKMMLENDAFSQLLNIRIIEIAPGYAKVTCTVNTTMLNGFYIAHGGVTYSLADSSLAFASNGHNIKAVSIETSISHIKKVLEGDILTAVCEEKSLTHKFGIYEVTVTNQKEEKVALFKGTVFRTGEKWVS